MRSASIGRCSAAFLGSHNHLRYWIFGCHEQLPFEFHVLNVVDVVLVVLHELADHDLGLNSRQVLSNAVSLAAAERNEHVRVYLLKLVVQPPLRSELVRILVVNRVEVVSCHLKSNECVFRNGHASELVLDHCLSWKDSRARSVNPLGLVAHRFQVLELLEIVAGDVSIGLDDKLDLLLHFLFDFWILFHEHQHHSAEVGSE